MGAGISNASTYLGINQAVGKTIIVDEISVAGGTATIYTVSAGKTFFLLECTLAYYATTNNAGATIYKNLAGNVVLQMISSIDATKTVDSGHAELHFAMPIPFAAGDRIVVRSTVAGLTAYGTVLGWEE
jgi:hypothetical protein